MHDYEKALKNCGLKLTKHRKGIYDVLAKTDRPLDASEIYEKLIGSNVNLSTVYRTLEIFEEAKIVTKVVLSPNSTATYELNHNEHKHHLVCIKCHEVTAISGCPLKDYVAEVGLGKGYYIIEHKLEILGICPNCQTKS